MTPQSIGTYQEKSLHAAVKRWYAREGDVLEAQVQGFQVDILRGRTALEIQTRSFYAIKKKLYALLTERPVRLVYPVATERTLTRISTEGEVLSRRRSPKRGCVLDVCDELLRFPEILQHPNFTLEVLLVRDEEIRCEDGRGSWRRKGASILDRKLLEVLERRCFENPSDLLSLLPDSLSDPFTSRDAAEALGKPVWQTRKVLYCLKKAGCLDEVGRDGRMLLYQRASGNCP